MNKLEQQLRTLGGRNAFLLLGFGLILLGFVVRAIFPLYREFSFDQEQIAQAARKISQGKLTLIGPQTGPIAFHTGPLIYYLAAPIYWLNHFHPIANSQVSWLIYLVTAVVLWWFGKQGIKKKATLVFVGFYALSPFLVSLDLFTWNPNLSFLSASLTLLPLLSAVKGEVKRIHYLSGFLGMFLAYQAHFSGLLLLPIVGTCFLVFAKRFSRWLFFWMFLGFVVSLVPLLVFDLRHDFLNIRSVVAMLQDKEVVYYSVGILSRLAHNLLTSLENLGKFLYPTLPRPSLLLLAGLGLTLWLIRPGSLFTRQQKLVLGIWILTFPVVYMFYRRSVPEYYFLMQLPAWALILTDLVLPKSYFLAVTLGSLVLFSLSLGKVIDNPIDLPLRDKLLALQVIKDQVGTKPVALVLDMELKYQFGWDYLTNFAGLETDERSAETVHLIFPASPNALYTRKVNNLLVWFDPRSKIAETPYWDTNNGLLFFYPNHWQEVHGLERTFYPEDAQVKVNAFIPEESCKITDIKLMYMHFPSQDKDKFLVSDAQEETIYHEWIKWEPVKLKNEQIRNRRVVAHFTEETTYVIAFPDDFSESQIGEFLGQMEVR
jgi:hypothetical protein